MDIELGKPVIASDGENVGEVERLIVDAEAKVVREFLIKEGTFVSTDRVVDIELISRIDDDGVHLNVASDQIESLPAFVEERYSTPADHQISEMPQAWIGAAGGAGGGPLLWGAAGPGRGEPGQGSMFEPATVPGGESSTESPLDQGSVVIEEGTNVIDVDDESVGSVAEVHYDTNGRISGFLVKSGTIFTTDIHIPLKWVDSMQPDSIRLAVTAEQAENAGRVDS
jgi:uncharacterized protein YrrD